MHPITKVLWIMSAVWKEPDEFVTCVCLYQGSLVTCEFLLQNSASVNQQDSLGRGPLHHATILGHTGSVLLSTQFSLYKWLLLFVWMRCTFLCCDSWFTIFLLQTSMFISKTGSQSERSRRRESNAAFNRSQNSKRWYCHAVSCHCCLLCRDICVRQNV